MLAILRRFRAVTVAAMILGPLSCPAFSGPTESDWEARFLSEAPPAWERLRQFCNGTQAVVEEATQNSPDEGDADESIARITYNCDANNIIYIWRCSKGMYVGREYIFAFNPNYSFIIQKDSDEQSRRIRYVGVDRSKIYDRVESPGYMYYPLMMYMSSTIDKIVASPGFRMLKTSTIQKGGRELVKVEFKTDFKIRQRVELDGGWVVLDPDHYWSVQEFELSVNHNKPRVHGVTEYGEDISGFPIPVGGRLEHIDPKTLIASESKDLFRYHDFKLGAVPPAESRLPAYGFPETGFAKSTQSRWFLGLNLILIPIFIGLSMLFRKYSRGQVVG